MVDTYSLPFPDDDHMYLRLSLTLERNYNVITLEELNDIRTTLNFMYSRIGEELKIVDIFIKSKRDDVDKLLYRP